MESSKGPVNGCRNPVLKDEFMKYCIFIFLLTPFIFFASCTDDANPVIESGPVFSIKVLKANGDPAEGWRIGSINHPMGPRLNLGHNDFVDLKPGPWTPIEFTLPEAGNWDLSIKDYNGRLMRSYSGYSEAGVKQVLWDGYNLQDELVPSGFYHYFIVAGNYTDDKWMVMEKGPDPRHTILGTLDHNGQFATENIALFPGLINPQPIEYYTDTATFHISNPDSPDNFYYYRTVLNPDGNNYSFVLDSPGFPDALVKIQVVDTSGNPVPGIRVGSINHHYIDPFKSQVDPDTIVYIHFQVWSEITFVYLEIVDYYDRHVVTLVNEEEVEGGDHHVSWNGKDKDGNPVLSGYYMYRMIERYRVEEEWLVYERGENPNQTLIGETNSFGIYATVDTLVFPGLLGSPPDVMEVSGNPLGYFRYTDTVTFTLSDPEVPGVYMYFVRQLDAAVNNFEFEWNAAEVKGE